MSALIDPTAIARCSYDSLDLSCLPNVSIRFVLACLNNEPYIHG